MKEKICKKLKELSTKPVRRVDWSGERWFVRRYKQVLALGWIIYFLLREELVKEILRPVSSYLMNLSFIQWFYVNRLAFLLVFTFLLFLMKSIFSILRRYKFIRYSLLDEDTYPEYDFPFQEELVSFLNRKEERGRNIFWLNGAWGSGKTHFIRTFFENQFYKPREIYYISCFGIRTREQAEKVLIDEIEQHSIFGSLDHIPVVSSLVKWSYKILGLDLMKKYSLVIFDDLERVVYSEKKGDNQEEYTDSPEDYNNLLGFIDHLANYRNQKVLVLMNKEDMGNTYQKIVEEKFKPVVITIPSQERIIELLSKKYSDELFIQNFILNLFMFRCKRGLINLREIPQLVKSLEGINFKVEFEYIEKEQEKFLEILNSFEDLQKALESICDLIEGDIVGLNAIIAPLEGLIEFFDIDFEDYFKSALEVYYLIKFLEFCKDEFTSLRFDSTEMKFIFY
ncbi:TPA: P-loop NTPase fold protein [Streptococcus suis]